MTDPRLGDALWAVLAALPRGSGVIFRDYALSRGERRARWQRVRQVARRRGLQLIRAGAQPLPGEDGVHGAYRAVRPGIRTMPVHSRSEAIAAIRRGADLLLVSPVHATRSHPGARPLGRVRLGLMVRGLPVPVVALGGMDARRLRALRPLGITRHAAIDGWLKAEGRSRRRRGQKRKAVPT